MCKRQFTEGRVIGDLKPGNADQKVGRAIVCSATLPIRAEHTGRDHAMIASTTIFHILSSLR